MLEEHNRMRELLRKIRKILKDRRTRQIFSRVVMSIAAVVVFVTTYAMILPAITLEKTAVCGIEEHQHSDSCYEKILVCGKEVGIMLTGFAGAGLVMRRRRNDK